MNEVLTSNLYEIIKCEVCNSEELTPVLSLGVHPLCDDLIEIGSPNVCAEYPIDILFCKNCSTAHQRYQIKKKTLFPENYHYRSRLTGDVINGMKDLVLDYKNKYGNLSERKILDIGCNDGSLLDIFKDEGCDLTIGVEPTGAANDAKNKGHKIYQSYFDMETANTLNVEFGSLDLIVFTNVFAHIEDLATLLDALKILINENTIIVIENHYLGSILNRLQFDTFYHEHPRSYSLKSFKYISENLGLKLLDVKFPSRYGGNIRITLGLSNLEACKVVNIDEEDFLEKFTLMNKYMNEWRLRSIIKINNLVKKYGKLPAKAFPGRAAIILKLLELNECSISGIHEKPGSMKIGHFAPGTRIPIVSDDDLDLNSTIPILNMAWHIPSEIKRYLADIGYKGEMLNVFDPADYTN